VVQVEPAALRNSKGISGVPEKRSFSQHAQKLTRHGWNPWRQKPLANAQNTKHTSISDGRFLTHG